MKTGKVTKIYVYDFADGRFSFHTAQRSDGSRTVFRSRMDMWPSQRAQAKGINYKLLTNSSQAEIDAWLASHPNCPVKRKVTL